LLADLLRIGRDDVQQPFRHCEITAPPTIEELRKSVGGYIGTVHGFTSIDVYGDGVAMLCVAFGNEDNKRLDLPMNWLATARFGLLAEGGGYEDYLVGAASRRDHHGDLCRMLARDGIEHAALLGSRRCATTLLLRRSSAGCTRCRWRE
jgi:hypothetical protein